MHHISNIFRQFFVQIKLCNRGWLRWTKSRWVNSTFLNLSNQKCQQETLWITLPWWVIDEMLGTKKYTKTLTENVYSTFQIFFNLKYKHSLLYSLYTSTLCKGQKHFNLKLTTVFTLDMTSTSCTEMSLDDFSYSLLIK